MLTLTLLLTLMLTHGADPVPIVSAKLDRKTPVDYEKEIKPIFAAKCTVCHAGKITEGDFELSTLAKAMKGGKKGPAIVPGKPADSLLFLMSSHRKKPIMPPKTEDNPLTPGEVAIIERWITEGAKGSAEAEIKTRPAVALSVPAASVVPVRAVVVAADQSFAAAGRGNTVFSFDAKTGALKKPFVDPTLKATDGKPVNAAHISLVEAMTISPDGKTLATGSFREVTIWDIVTATPKRRIGGFAHSVVALTFSPDGQTLAAAGGAPTEDGEVRLIEVASGRVTLDLKQPHSDTVFGVAFSPDGKRLATASADKFVKVFDLPAGTPAKSFEGHTQHVLDVAWTPDGKRLVSAGADAIMKVWDFEKGEKVRDIAGFGKQITRLAAFGKTPSVLAVAGDGTVRNVNVETGGTNRNYPAGSGFQFAVAGSANGESVVAGGEDGIVRLFEGKSGKLIKELTGK